MRSIDRIAAENLATWQQAAQENRELRMLQAAAWGRSSAEALLQGTRKELLLNAGEAEHAPHALQIDERVAFCSGVLEILPDYSKEIPDLAEVPRAPRVAFLDGFFSREAMRRFERLLPRARAVTASSFTAVCEEVAGDNADFALLPLEDSREGKLLHLFEEIDRFELQITHACDIPYPDEGRTVTVGLLSHRYRPMAHVNGKRMLALSVFEEEPHTLTDLLSVARETGVTLHRVDALPAPYGADGIFYHPVFCTQENSERLLEVYLSLFMPRTRITGRYIHLTK